MKNLFHKAKRTLQVASLRRAPQHLGNAIRAFLVRILADALLLARQEHADLLAWERTQPTAAERLEAATTERARRRQAAIDKMGVVERAARNIPLNVARTPEGEARLAEYRMVMANRADPFARGPELLAAEQRVQARHAQARQMLLQGHLPEAVAETCGFPLDVIVAMHSKIFRLPAPQRPGEGENNGE